ASKRPCGVAERTRRPPKAAVRSRARPWRVCPSGKRAGVLVPREQVDPTLVALLVTPRRGEERGDDGLGLLHRVHASTDRDDLGIVVLAGGRRGLGAPGERGPRALHLVRGDLLAVARTADDDAERLGIGDRGLGGRGAHGRVVVERVVLMRSVVGDLVPLPFEERDEVLLEFVTRVIRGD